MKHPSSDIESFEYNLGKASELRCANNTKYTHCGECESCVLLKQIISVKSWLGKCGDQSKRHFMLGLVRRLQSVNLVQYVVNLLQPLLCKDYMYARTKPNPGLDTDKANMACDRALDVHQLETHIEETWLWFRTSNYWTKCNFILALLKECDSHLLFTIGVHAKTILSAEEKAFQQTDDYESASIAETVYTHRSEDHPELDLLTETRPTYSAITTDPFTPLPEEGDDIHTPSPQIPNTSTPGVGNPSSPRMNPSVTPGGVHPSRPSSTPGLNPSMTPEIYNDDSGDDCLSDCSIDPTLLVVPSSSKAHAGVARHKDFIRELPVFLSKYILGFLDHVSLNNCVCVSKMWRYLAEEVHNEYGLNQQLQEEVMLMQGAAAQGCNPLYAKDIDVPVPNMAPDSWEIMRTEEDLIQPTFKSEVDFKTAYTGYSTRNIIMEERNVYCGAYNVMVLVDQPDISRVVHTNGAKLIALGSQDRKVKLINSETGLVEDPAISGHAGSIRCVAVNEERGYVLSGSYDTSIRMWCLETGKCQRILRGHRDTVSCMEIVGDLLISGAKDNMCKVWNLNTGKCTHTFKHRKPISAVSMSEDFCISACEGGNVKVWDIKTGKLIKRMKGHSDAITAVEFDRWHIVTASKDGYALVWSALGDHKRCLTALRHPTEVLCLAFMYLRVITGSLDGKLRIWNAVTGQCLRIMRGNSRSDPIYHLIAIGNRVTINTSNNLLVLNFEPVDHDYTLENDKMPPRVQYSKFSDAPFRHQPYPYVRAQRMSRAGATNTKIVYHDEELDQTGFRRSLQTPHSAKTLSRKSMELARRIQSAGARPGTAKRMSSAGTHIESRAGTRAGTAVSIQTSSALPTSPPKHEIVKSVKSVSTKPPSGPNNTKNDAKSKYQSTKSDSHTHVSIAGFKVGHVEDEDSDLVEEKDGNMRRRVSWAFEKPLLAQSTKEINLHETKALLRSQIRAQGDVVPPDFIYLSVNAIQAGMKPTEATKNMDVNQREAELALSRRLGRPSSSPSKLDPRTKVPIDELSWEQFFMEQGIAPTSADGKSVAESKMSSSTRTSARSKSIVPDVPMTTTLVRELVAVPVSPVPYVSRLPKTKSTLPKARLFRPHTAAVQREIQAREPSKTRAKSAGSVGERGSVHVTSRPSTAASGKHARQPLMCTTSALETNIVPMLMYPSDMKSKMAAIRDRRIERQKSTLGSCSESSISGGAVSNYNDPLRNHVEFKLYTHEQISSEMNRLEDLFCKQKRERERGSAKLLEGRKLNKHHSAAAILTSH